MYAWGSPARLRTLIIIDAFLVLVNLDTRNFNFDILMLDLEILTFWTLSP